jgi:hypothetical protein
MTALTLGFASTFAPVFGEASVGERLERIQASARWDGRRFRNSIPTTTTRWQDSWALVRAYATNKAEMKPPEPLPTEQPAPLAAQGDNRLRITWMGPEAAVGVHQQVRGGVMIPVHWGTFNLALHAWDAPIVELIDLAEARSIPLAAPLAGGVIDPQATSIAPLWQERHALAR